MRSVSDYYSESAERTNPRAEELSQECTTTTSTKLKNTQIVSSSIPHRYHLLDTLVLPRQTISSRIPSSLIKTEKGISSKKTPQQEKKREKTD
ncbi:hypothetical protein PGTUg99_002937 [Puccinia graminis f. sp. tritici]|uniref:Uncharacterized protein n=1 Tax=Puccinia graminis f. sp. tritici TaxID=56615 RepID=A0A5B0RA92_PUCGR|nr:hypothetical protein PGTUg99_002937 [Puccinia graminis f. sp. tritici]